MRVNAWKLCQQCSRPLPFGAEDIGTWFTILQIISTCAVFTNAGLVAFTGTFVIDYSWPVRAWVFIGMSCLVFSLKLLVAAWLPDVPAEVEIQLQRNDYFVDKVSRR
jgi:anoctamin-10/anoctamin-7